jgi:long-chain acyl-CoA synthetase
VGRGDWLTARATSTGAAPTVSTDSIPARLFANARRYAHRPAYYVKHQGVWKATSWAKYAAQVRQAARALKALGLGRGDTVGILGFNRPEWTIADLACMCIGGAPAGIYTTCSAAEVQYIVDHAESKVVLVDSRQQWDKIAQVRERLPKLVRVITMTGVEPIADPLVLSWDEFLAQGESVGEQVVDAAVDALEPDALATLIYTSGTTGPPKGVMLSHRNLCWTATALCELTDIAVSDSVLSYLPLSHIAEQQLSIHGPCTTGLSVFFSESMDRVADNLKEVQPTVFFGVPRIWEKFQAGIEGKLSEASGIKAGLLAWARRVGAKVNSARNRQADIDDTLAIQYALARRLVFDKLKGALGLARCRLFVSGAAPVTRELLGFFASLDIVVQEVYGQSEDCGATTFNARGRTRFGTVGQPVPGVEVTIADDREIVVKGANVFLGYFKDDDATREALIDGWLHSGDLGEFDADGFLSITGRKKDIIITSGGKNITPKNIEEALKAHELVAEAVVIGDRRKYLTALVTLDDEAALSFLARKKLSNGMPPYQVAEVRAAVQQAVDAINQDLARVETLKNFTILPRNFRIEDGELTPTLKIKRAVVARNWAREIDAMYKDEASVT